MDKLDLIIEGIIHSATASDSSSSSYDEYNSQASSSSDGRLGVNDLFFNDKTDDLENIDVAKLSTKLHDQLQERANGRRQSSIKYLYGHPEIKAVIMIFLKAALEQRPSDLREFAKEFFGQQTKDELQAQV
jgi:hypothetical protein